AVEEVELWLRANGLRLSTSKSCCVLLRGRLDRERPPVVRTGGGRIPYTRTVTYLGFRLTERLGYVEHLKCIRDRTVEVFSGLRRLVRCAGGVRGLGVARWYEAVFLGMVRYGLGAWGHCLSMDWCRRLLLSAQRQVLLCLTRACR